MTKKIAKIPCLDCGKLYLGQFYTKHDGLSLEVLVDGEADQLDCVKLNKKQVLQLVRELQNWLGETELPWKRKWKHDGKLVVDEAGNYVGTACSEVSAKCFIQRHNQ